MAGYPIVPGSGRDKTLDRMVDRMLEDDISIGSFQYSTQRRCDLMAIRTRQNAREAGLTVADLPALLKDAWYGQFPDGPTEREFEAAWTKLFGRRP